MSYLSNEDLGKPFVKISWYGHAMFAIEDDEGTRVITDPYDPQIGYNFPEIEANIVTVSHDHFDHNNVKGVKGNPIVIKEASPRDISGVKIEGVTSYHDASSGSERGSNIIYRWEMAGLNLAHLGDLGHPLDSSQAERLRDLDILFIPVGGVFTIDGEAAASLVEEIKPRVVIPMHYKTPVLNLPIAGVEPFTQRFKDVEDAGKNPIYLGKSNIPQATKVIVLDYLE